MKPLEEMGKFKTVVVDPPWSYQFFSPHGGGHDDVPYGTITVNEVYDLPITKVLDHNANVFLWTPQRFLPNCFSIGEHWKLGYRFTMVWHKNGGPQFYDGPAQNAEFCVVFGNGKADWQDVKAFDVANYWPRGAHSEKPEGFYDLLRRVTPGPRLDIFGRRRIAGFHSWGLEAPEGEPLPDHYQMVLA